VDVSVSLRKIDSALAGLRWTTLVLSGLVTVALTALLSWITRRTIVKPVRRLVRATRRIAAGDLDQPVARGSSDELGLLADSFDDMREALIETRRELGLLMADLERQVEERTLALRGAQAQLIQREKLASLGKLSASIAHEINNPLAGILTFSKLMVRTMEEGPLGEAGRAESVQRLKLIQRETERCTAIVRNLLDFARQRPPDLRDVDIRAALDESLALVDHQVQMQGIALETQLDSHPVARADFGQLRQAFVNVMLNACDAMGKGGRLTVRCRAEAGEAVVSIADTGSGISEQDLPRIFDPFFTTKEKGTGLGLSVVYGIVQGLGGRLDIESRPGDGTIVLFRFPLSASERAAVAARAPDQRA
jgi:two-component system NtrC family sensor kinase